RLPPSPTLIPYTTLFRPGQAPRPAPDRLSLTARAPSIGSFRPETIPAREECAFAPEAGRGTSSKFPVPPDHKPRRPFPLHPPLWAPVRRRNRRQVLLRHPQRGKETGSRPSPAAAAPNHPFPAAVYTPAASGKSPRLRVQNRHPVLRTHRTAEAHSGRQRPSNSHTSPPPQTASPLRSTDA